MVADHIFAATLIKVACSYIIAGCTPADSAPLFDHRASEASHHTSSSSGLARASCRKEAMTASTLASVCPMLMTASVPASGASLASYTMPGAETKTRMSFASRLRKRIPQTSCVSEFCVNYRCLIPRDYKFVLHGASQTNSGSKLSTSIW